MALLLLSRRPLTLCLLLSWLSAVTALSTTYSKDVYYQQYDAGQNLDQAAYKDPKFWSDLDEALPRWRTDPKLERFRGFCDNLQSEVPGRQVILPNGQHLLSQYVFPGLEEEDNVHRSAYPSDHFEELKQLQRRLEKDVAPVARKELDTLLEHKPLVDDDVEFAGYEGNDGDTWQRAAWYGWQFLSLRGAKRFMPATAKALKQAMGSMGPAHRFVGLARHKRDCVGVEHSDNRNYMLSTLTPVSCPEGCGIIVDGQDAKLTTDGPAVILDNTFLHHVYNDSKERDRFCLMSECWHPALTDVERDALSTLFAVKDRFTVLELQLAPWGYDDDDLEVALKTGAVYDLDFWKEIGYDVHAAQSRKTSTKSKKRSEAKGFGQSKGFGKK